MTMVHCRYLNHVLTGADFRKKAGKLEKRCACLSGFLKQYRTLRRNHARAATSAPTDPALAVTAPTLTPSSHQLFNYVGQHKPLNLPLEETSVPACGLHAT